MRDHFEEQLEELNSDLVTMAKKCNEAVELALQALLEKDVTLAERVKELENRINSYQDTVAGLCLTLIMTQQPVASDLRFITAALRINTDLERIGDQAYDIAILVEEMAQVGYRKKELASLKAMAQITQQMLEDAITAFKNGDSALARRAGGLDDQVDESFRIVRQEGIEEIRRGEYDAARIIDGLFIAKYLERIGDHAQNIAEAVLFSLTGQKEDLDQKD